MIVGGGIVGSAAAYRLARSGEPVTLIDGSHAGQATAAGAGIIAPGTAVNAPPAFHALSTHAVAYYPNLLAHLAEDGETETGYATVGSIFVATNEEEAQRLDAVAAFAEAQRMAGVHAIDAVRCITGTEARRLFPPLADIPGAVHVAGSARVDGRLMRDALQRAAARRGATIIRGTAHLRGSGDRVDAVAADGDRYHARSVTLAAGAWTASLAGAIGAHVPVFPQRGQILHLRMPTTDTSRWPIVHGFHSHYLLAFPPDRVVAGATRESDAGFDCRITAGGMAEVTREALRVAPGLAGATVAEMRVGLRPASPDGLPLLGPVPGIDNLFIATGHGPSGLQLGPISGALIADLLLGKPAALDLAPLAPNRF